MLLINVDKLHTNELLLMHAMLTLQIIYEGSCLYGKYEGSQTRNT